MKRNLLTGIASLACALSVCGQTATTYINDGLVNCPPQIPPQIDAFNFVNNNLFSVNFTNVYITLPIYDTSSTLNFTNRGLMQANTGFRLDYGPASSGQRRMAQSIFNPGVIAAGSAQGAFFPYVGGSKLYMNATNIVQTGTNVVGVDGLLRMTGKHVDLSRSLIRMEGYNSDDLQFGLGFAFFNSIGIFDVYWGTNTQVFFPPANFQQDFVVTPPHNVQQIINGQYINFQTALAIANPQVYVNLVNEGTNIFAQVAYIGNTNAAIANRVFFAEGGSWDIGVEWAARSTNAYTGIVTTNFLNLLDSFGVRTNFGLNTNAFTGLSTPTVRPSSVPENLTFFQGGFFGNQASAPLGSVAGVFQGGATNQYAAYSVLLAPTSQLTNNVIGQNITNLPGRIEITADRDLNLARTRIEALNYLLLKATNHFVGSARASIEAPYSDVNLASTNGGLTVSNLVSPTIARLSGDVDVYSTRWTNGTTGFRYHVLVVDSHLDRRSPAFVQDLSLRSTNVVIGDIVNISRDLKIEAENLTITTNVDDANIPRGEINVLSQGVVWSSSTPLLRNLTNNGALRALNAVYFGGVRHAPYFNGNFNEPYVSLINNGEIINQGTTVWADLFQNRGLIFSGLGSINIEARTATAFNGFFIATNGDVAVAAESLVLSNQFIQAARSLSFSVTNLLTDIGTNLLTGTNVLNSALNANTWIGNGSLSLYHKPLAGDLLRSSFSSSLPPYTEAVNVWAGEDRGPVVDGFTNNVALGRLILDGQLESQFTFTGTGASNAIYVDSLELRGYMTNRDAGGNFVGLQIDSNMKVYFAQATLNGASVAEKMDKQNGGRLIWIPSYAGTYSGTNVIYPDGSTNFFNTALITSCNLDSDGDGLVNCSDTTPVQRPQDLTLSVELMNGPAAKAKVSWQTGPYAVNTVYYKEVASSTNWLVLTNFSSGAAAGRVHILDPVKTSAPRYYRVRVDAKQP